MEIPGSALTGALRVGLQIVFSAKRPMLEVFHQVRNVIHPEVEYTLPGAGGGASSLKDRRQEVLVTFTAANIGAVRAENLKFRIQPGLRRNHGWAFGELFETTIPSFAPGQVIHLLSFGEFDFWNYEPDGPNSQRPSTFKTEMLPILVEYDGPWAGWNRVFRLWGQLRKKPQFSYLYRFNPLSVATDLPPPQSI